MKIFNIREQRQKIDKNLISNILRISFDLYIIVNFENSINYLGIDIIIEWDKQFD